MTEDPVPDPGFASRCLLRAAREATLATVGPGGAPFASLVTPATAPDLSVLLFLSTLSEHTRHLACDPRCAVLAAGAPNGANPQMKPRVTVTGVAERLDGEAGAGLKARWLAIHPYAALYAGFGDFALWRIVPGEALYVGGFAMARRVATQALLPDPGAAEAVAAAEARIIAHMNEDHGDAMDAIARRLLGLAGTGWTMAAVDVDGCDLTLGEVVARLPFDAPVMDAKGVREALVAATNRARDSG